MLKLEEIPKNKAFCKYNFTKNIFILLVKN